VHANCTAVLRNLICEGLIYRSCDDDCGVAPLCGDYVCAKIESACPDMVEDAKRISQTTTLTALHILSGLPRELFTTVVDILASKCNPKVEASKLILFSQLECPPSEDLFIHRNQDGQCSNAVYEDYVASLESKHALGSIHLKQDEWIAWRRRILIIAYSLLILSTPLLAFMLQEGEDDKYVSYIHLFLAATVAAPRQSI